MASTRAKVTEPIGDVALTTILRQRLRSEGMKDVKVNANSVNVPGGQLMATFTLCFPQSIPDDRRLKMEKIALEECASYIQAPHILEISPNQTTKESRAMGWIRAEPKIEPIPILRT
jgi:hypothetical protein